MGAVQTATDNFVYTAIEEPEVVIVPKCNVKVDSTRILANPTDFRTVDKEVGDLRFHGAKMVLTLWETINKGC